MPKGTMCVVFISPAHGGFVARAFSRADLLHSRLQMHLSSGL